MDDRPPRRAEAHPEEPLRLAPGEAGGFVLSGALTARSGRRFWDSILRPGRGGADPEEIRLDLGRLSAMDLNGAAQLLWLKQVLAKSGRKLALTDPPEPLAPIWNLAVATLPPPAAAPRGPGPIEAAGRKVRAVAEDVADLTAFFGEILSHLARLAPRPWRIRWRMAMGFFERSAVDALPVTCLVAFLVGLILAFQSAMFMRLFGVDIFVADLVGLSVIRELGTLLTAIVLTGRSGSAFSAELGSMRTNQEIDAFLTMGLSPAADLALPRILGLAMATPLLTVLADLSGLLGGNLVMLTLGHPIAAFWVELSGHLGLSDVTTGLFKALVFGLVVALIGCQRGLSAGSGPGAVGVATTKGVVTNIVVLAFLDSLFAVVFYVLGW
jgi:phospholipid/cholesterol/gamma-HCH transport system permease protein